MASHDRDGYARGNEVVETRRRTVARGTDLMPRPHEYPPEPVREDYTQHRQSRRESYSPEAYRPRHYDNVSGERSRSFHPPDYRRQPNTVREEDRFSSYDSDSERSRSRHPRRRNSVHEQRRVVACSKECAENDHKIAASDEDESDTGSCSSAEAERRRKQLRKRQLITVGLAGVTTVAAGNNFYQATKAHKARRKQLTEGRMCTSEEKRLKDEGVKRDLISVGLAAVAVYNLRKGWGRMLDSRKEYREACEGKQEPRQRQGTGTGTGTGLGVDTSHPSAPRLTRRGHGDVDADFYFDA